jgi:hypothetical protein
MTEEIKSKIEAVRHKERNNLVEDDFRARAKEVLESAMVTAKTPQNNVEEEDARTRARELLAASTVVTKTPQPRNDLGIFAVDNNSVFGVKGSRRLSNWKTFTWSTRTCQCFWNCQRTW